MLLLLLLPPRDSVVTSALLFSPSALAQVLVGWLIAAGDHTAHELIFIHTYMHIIYKYKLWG